MRTSDADWPTIYYSDQRNDKCILHISFGIRYLLVISEPTPANKARLLEATQQQSRVTDLSIDSSGVRISFLGLPAIVLEDS